MSKTLVIVGITAFLNYSSSSDYIAHRIDNVSQQKQIDCIHAWEQAHPQLASKVVYTWHGSQPNEQFVHTFDLRVLVNNRVAPIDQHRGVLIDGQFYASVENYYQSEKIERIRAYFPEIASQGKYSQQVDQALKRARTGSPMDAFKAVRVKLPNGKQLNDYLATAMHKGYITRQELDAIMYQADYAKFQQYHGLQTQLLNIHHDGGMIVEASPRDAYWGIQMTGSTPGKNRLGEILQQVSSDLDTSSKLTN